MEEPFWGDTKINKKQPTKEFEDSQKTGNKSFETKNDSNFLALRPTVMVKQCQVCPQIDLDLTISYHILPLFRSQKSQKSNVSNNRKNIISGNEAMDIRRLKKNRFCQTDVQIPSVPIQCYNFQETTEKNKQRRCWVVWIENPSWIRCLLFASMHHDCAPRQTLGVLEESKWIPKPHWWLRTWDSWSSLHKFRWRNAKLKASFIEIGMLIGQHAITTHWCGVNQSTHKQIQ